MGFAWITALTGYRKASIVACSRSGPIQTVMGRFDNLMLVNGETEFNLPAQQGEVVRFYLSNTANLQNIDLRIPGAKMKLAGGDNGRVEKVNLAAFRQQGRSLLVTATKQELPDAVGSVHPTGSAKDKTEEVHKQETNSESSDFMNLWKILLKLRFQRRSIS